MLFVGRQSVASFDNNTGVRLGAKLVDDWLIS